MGARFPATALSREEPDRSFARHELLRVTLAAHRMLRRTVAFVALAFLPLPLAAQSAASGARISGRMAFENIADIFSSQLVTAFDSIPAAKYDFRPTPAQQSVGYIAQHLERANYDLCQTIGNLKHPMTAKDSLRDSVKARWPKDTLVKRLRASLRFCDSALARVDTLDYARLSYLLRFETDLAEHYSQIAVYMRLLGLVPPSALPPRQRTAIELPVSTLSRYVGMYELTPGLQFDVRLRESALFITSSVAPALRLWPESSSDFFIKEVDAQVSFIRDASGAVTGLVLHRFGRERTAPKIR